MAITKPAYGTIWEDGAATCIARILGNAGTAITQASLTAISYKIFDIDSSTPTTAITSSTLTISSVVFDTLQTGARWTVDSTGYNFLNTFAASNFATPDHRYRIEIIFDPTSGEDFPVVFEIAVVPIVGS